MANSDAERAVIRARMKANQARTMIEKRCAGQPEMVYNTKMLEFIRECVTSDVDEAKLVGKMLSAQHLKWQRENGFI